MNNNIKIGFAGLTHLGINSAVAAAAMKFDVICYDPSAFIVQSLLLMRPHIKETNLIENLEKNKKRLYFTRDVQELSKCDIVYISQDVETNSNGTSDLTALNKLIKNIIPELKEDCLLVILCQVPPGFCRGLDFDMNRLYYQVETLIFGRAIERAMYPERFIIGTNNPDTELDKRFIYFLNSFKCPILKMNYESAELAKISINLYLTASVTITNTLAEVCENIGSVWTEIVPALKLDKRIGPHAYLTPGLGISGGNLERDLKTILKIGAKKKTDVSIIKATIKNSNYRKDWLWRTLKNSIRIKKNTSIAILGLVYKEGTSSTKNSPSLRLLSHLKNYKTRIYDPFVNKKDFPEYNWYDNVLECIRGVNVVVLCTQIEEFRKIKIQDLLNKMEGNHIIDPFALLNHEECMRAKFKIYTLGRENA